MQDEKKAQKSSVRRRIIAIVSSIAVALALVTAVFMPMRTSAVSTQQMVSVAVEILVHNEGSYGSVNANDNGAVSLGILQWHGTRALSLCRTVASADTATAQSLLGQTFYEEIMSVSSWDSRTLSSSEASAVSALLTTSAGVSAQDNLAASDVSGYISVAQNSYGLSDPSVIVYFTELYNRGSGVASRIMSSACGGGSYSSITLDMLHSAALSDSSNASGGYTSRLNYAYNRIVSESWSVVAETSCDDGDLAISATSTVVEDTSETTETVVVDTSDFSESYAGDYVCVASSLNVRSAPTTASSVIGSISYGSTVTVISGNGSWAQINYNGNTGYVSMDYLEDAIAVMSADIDAMTAADEECADDLDEMDEEEYDTYEEYEEYDDGEDEEIIAVEEEIVDDTVLDATYEEEWVEPEVVEVLTEGVSDPAIVTEYGDISGSGEVSLADVVALQRYLNGEESLDEVALANADCCRDDVLDDRDVNAILMQVTGRLIALPIV